jgi:hypothetical protein
LNDFALVIPPEELSRYAAQLIAYGQSKGHNLVPEGLGKGKIGIEAKIVLGMEPERPPESVLHSPASLGYINGHNTSQYPMDSTRSMNYGDRPMSGRGGYYGTDMSSQPGYYHDNRSSSDIADSETEVSTDEDSTIRARSGSESEASEWGVDSSTGDEGDGAETETEGEDDEDDEDVIGHRAHRFTRAATVGAVNSSSSSAGARMGRLRDVHSSAGLHHPEG